MGRVLTPLVGNVYMLFSKSDRRILYTAASLNCLAFIYTVSYPCLVWGEFSHPLLEMFIRFKVKAKGGTFTRRPLSAVLHLPNIHILLPIHVWCGESSHSPYWKCLYVL